MNHQQIEMVSYSVTCHEGKHAGSWAVGGGGGMGTSVLSGEVTLT